MSEAATRIETWADISEHFEFLDDQLVYVDAPLEGIVRALDSGELYAFRCTPIIHDRLWHWVLLAVESPSVSVTEAFEKGTVLRPREWISIVEDRRGEEAVVRAAWMKGERQGIPTSAG